MVFSSRLRATVENVSANYIARIWTWKRYHTGLFKILKMSKGKYSLVAHARFWFPVIELSRATEQENPGFDDRGTITAPLLKKRAKCWHFLAIRRKPSIKQN
jgi:hypothetical protein